MSASSVSAIADMEAKGAGARLRQATQRILDVTVERAPEPVRRRFEALLADMGPAVASDIDALDDVHAVDQLGEGSGQRTKSLVGTLQVGTGSQMRYLPPAGVVEMVGGFLRTSSRVFIVTGAPGCGKTRLVQHLAVELNDRVDMHFPTWR